MLKKKKYEGKEICNSMGIVIFQEKKVVLCKKTNEKGKKKMSTFYLKHVI